MGKNYQLGTIFRRWGRVWLGQHPRIATTVKRAILDIGACRTQVLGGMEVTCRQCGCTHKIYASCGNRNCPICPALKKEIWLLKRQQELLPVPYYHVVFTLPSELNDLCMNHPKVLYNILFRSAWESLNGMLKQPKWCGGQSGMLAILHTWGQNLSFHPHLHCIVPAGGLSVNRKRWQPCKKSSVLVDVKELSAAFRKVFLRKLREYWESEDWDFGGSAKKYDDLEEWRALFQSLDKSWVVYAKSPTAGATQTLNYLSRYTHAVAISEYRILKVRRNKVKIQYKDYADKDEKGIPIKKKMRLKGMEFINRFVRHILPKGFQKIRYYGIWAPANRKRKLATCQQLLAHIPLKLTMEAIKALVKQKMGLRTKVCPDCGSEDLVTTLIAPQTRPKVYRFLNRAPPNYGAPHSLRHFQSA